MITGLIRLLKFVLFLIPAMVIGAGAGFRWAWKAAKEPFYLETSGSL